MTLRVVPLALALLLAPALPVFPQADLERGGRLTYRPQPHPLPKVTRNWQLVLPRAPRAGFDYGPERDPKYNARYPFRLQVLCGTEEEGTGAQRRFVVHFLLPEDEPLARRCGGVLARLYWIGADYLGVGPAGRNYLNLWLTRQGEPGGEEHQGHLYLHAVQEPRAAAEWLRELAHEYSHAVLPPFPGFTAPEPLANGYLGERLFLKWLLDDQGLSHAWSEPVDVPAYLRRQIEPLRDRVLLRGGADPRAGRRDEQGMDAFLGHVLAVESLHGVEVLRAAFGRMGRGPAAAFPAALEAALSGQPRIPLRAAGRVPGESEPGRAPGTWRRLVFQALLPCGDWRVVPAGAPPDGAALTCPDSRSSVTPHPDGWRLRIAGERARWIRLEVRSRDETGLAAEGLVLERGADG